MTKDFKLVREYQGWEVECLSDIDIPQEWINLSYPNDEHPSFLFNGFQIFIAEKDIDMRGAYKDFPRFYLIHAIYYGELGCFYREFKDFNEVIDYVNNNYGAWIHKKG